MNKRNQYPRAFGRRAMGGRGRPGQWMAISLMVTFLVGITMVVGAVPAQHTIPRRPNVHFDLDSFDYSMPGCECSGEGELILRATSARLVGSNTAVNARTDVEVQVFTSGTGSAIEFVAEGESEVSLSAAGMPKQVMTERQPFSETSTAYDIPGGIAEVVSIDSPIKLSEIERYIKGTPEGQVAVSVSVAHEAKLSVRITCWGEYKPASIDLGTVRWTRNYLVTGTYEQKTGRLVNRRVVLDPAQAEIDAATF